ncbi:MAG: GAF domain-containing protein [Acidobacteria bacterium]|nr:GAF domain-containing protein [Acidobacteriota bacterium]
MSAPRHRKVEASLETIERARRSLWRTAFVILIAFSLAVVVVSYWSDSLPAALGDLANLSALRFVFLLLALGFIAYAIERERHFQRFTKMLVEERGRVESLEARLRELSALAEVSDGLRDILDEDEMLQAIARSAGGLVGAPRAAVLIADPDEGVLRPRAAFGPPPEEPVSEIPIEGGPLPSAAFSRGGTRIEPGPEVAWAGPGPSLAVPLIAQDRALGVLWAGGGGPALGEYERRLLGLVADQAAVALANVRAYAHERESVRRLAELDRMKTDFIATITHELKTPLTSLLGYMTILRRRGDTLPAEQREEFFGIMSRQGERILRLIEELLQSSRIEAGAGRLRREHLDLAGLIDTVVTQMRSVAREHSISVSVPVQDLGIYGDPIAIEHILSNLLDNALKYSRADGTIAIEVADGCGEVRVSVSDEGIGIAEEDLPHIFDRFRQASGGGRGRGSVGLGLYIVRGLVEAHGGRVWAESNQGRGSIFTFSLPRRRARAGEAAADGEMRAEAAQEDAAPAPISVADPIDFPA